jgi:hypothetical protein
MRIGRSTASTGQTRVVVLTADGGLEESVRGTFSTSAQIDLHIVNGTLSALEHEFHFDGATVIIIDLDA